MDIVSDSVMTNEPAEQYMHNVCKLKYFQQPQAMYKD